MNTGVFHIISMNDSWNVITNFSFSLCNTTKITFKILFIKFVSLIVIFVDYLEVGLPHVCVRTSMNRILRTHADINSALIEFNRFEIASKQFGKLLCRFGSTPIVCKYTPKLKSLFIRLIKYCVWRISGKFLVCRSEISFNYHPRAARKLKIN